MTFYHVYRSVAPLTFREVLNESRGDGRWPGEDPDSVVAAVARTEAKQAELNSPSWAGLYLAIPQHRNTLISVDWEGTTRRSLLSNYAEE